nr:hypothetical protein [Pedobacter sp. ASV2]
MGNNPVDHVDPDGGEDGLGKPKEPTYVGNGRKSLNEVTISEQRLNGYGRMGLRTQLGFDSQKFMNGKADYEAMYTSSTYAAMKKPKDLQVYLIEVAMWADGAEGLYFGGKFLYKGGGYLAKRYFARKIGIEIVEVAAKGGSKELFNFSTKAAEYMANSGRAVPIQTLEQAIKSTKGVLDPRGSRALMHTTEMFKNGKAYNLEVLYDKATNSIWHFKYWPK